MSWDKKQWWVTGSQPTAERSERKGPEPPRRQEPRPLPQAWPPARLGVYTKLDSILMCGCGEALERIGRVEPGDSVAPWGLWVQPSPHDSYDGHRKGGRYSGNYERTYAPWPVTDKDKAIAVSAALSAGNWEPAQ